MDGESLTYFDDFLFAKNVTPTDVHVSTALGNADEAGRKARRARRPADVGKFDAARSLKPRDDGMAHSPFPHDANILGQLREDQVPRFFGALTSRENLPVKSMPLATLTAMQNRVDPAKVEAMAQKGVNGGDKPVVVRTNGRDYIADGHHRLSAAWLKGDDAADCHFLDLTNYSAAVKHVAKVAVHVDKIDADKQMIFGWASVVEIDGVRVVDKQGDVIHPDTLEEAAYDFVMNGRDHGHMHDNIGTGTLIESMMFTKEKQQALGIDLGKVGLWVGFKVENPDVWKACKSGHLAEFSIGGLAIREEIAE